jgi:hypothetical protein
MVCPADPSPPTSATRLRSRVVQARTTDARAGAHGLRGPQFRLVSIDEVALWLIGLDLEHRDALSPGQPPDLDRRQSCWALPCPIALVHCSFATTLTRPSNCLMRSRWVVHLNRRSEGGFVESRVVPCSGEVVARRAAPEGAVASWVGARRTRPVTAPLWLCDDMSSASHCRGTLALIASTVPGQHCNEVLVGSFCW